MTFTVLVSSAGRRVSLMRSLREAVAATGQQPRILACDMTWNAAAMRTADAGFIVPPCTDPAFGEHMAKLCAQEGVGLVVPTIDTELAAWARLRYELTPNGTSVGVSDEVTVRIAADKRLTNGHCRAIGVPCPRQATAEIVLEQRGVWSLPLVAKPPAGSASQGLRHITSWAELERLVGEDVVVEERAEGIEHTVDVYVDRAGVARCPVVRRRIEVRAGEVSKALVVRDEHLASLAVRTVESLPGAYGPMNVQIFADRDQASVIEINARFGGGYPLTWRAGGRHGEWLVREAIDGTVEIGQSRVEYGLMMLRWDDEVFVYADR